MNAVDKADAIDASSSLEGKVSMRKHIKSAKASTRNTEQLNEDMPNAERCSFADAEQMDTT